MHVPNSSMGHWYEKQKHASQVATLVQQSLPPSAATNAPGDASPAAMFSAVQPAIQNSSLCIKSAQTRNSRSKTSEVQIDRSSRSPELKKLKRCNFPYKRQCGLLVLLDDCIRETICSFC